MKSSFAQNASVIAVTVATAVGLQGCASVQAIRQDASEVMGAVARTVAPDSAPAPQAAPQQQRNVLNISPDYLPDGSVAPPTMRNACFETTRVKRELDSALARNANDQRTSAGRVEGAIANQGRRGSQSVSDAVAAAAAGTVLRGAVTNSTTDRLQADFAYAYKQCVQEKYYAAQTFCVSQQSAQSGSAIPATNRSVTSCVTSTGGAEAARLKRGLGM